jgi:hypothetical protein
MNKIIFILFLLISNCSTYTVKSDNAKNGVVEKTPDWYVTYDRVSWGYYQEAASSVSPDMELAVKKSILLAKAKIADRINGEMNNRTTVSKNENGINENLNLHAGSQDILVNVISDTLVNNYEVIKEEIYSTGDKSYRAYILLRISKDNVEKVISDIEKKKLAEVKSVDLNKQAKELLNSKKN